MELYSINSLSSFLASSRSSRPFRETFTSSSLRRSISDEAASSSFLNSCRFLPIDEYSLSGITGRSNFRRRLKKSRAAIDKQAIALKNIRSKLKNEEKLCSRAKSSFKAELLKFDLPVIPDNEYSSIRRNLHELRKEELAASSEMERLREEEVKVFRNGREDREEARKLERELMEYSSICVASRDDVKFLSSSSFDHVKVQVVAGCSEVVKQEIHDFCRQKGLKV